MPRLDPPGSRPEAKDLRLPALGAAAWAGALGWPVLFSPAVLPLRLATGAALALTIGVLTGLALRDRSRATAVAALLVLLGAGAVAVLHGQQLRVNPVAALAERAAQVSVVATVTSDPRTIVGAHDTRQLVRVTVRRVTGRGETYALRTPVLVLGEPGWASVELGATVRAHGRLAVSDPGSGHTDVAALLVAGEPSVVGRPGLWWRASATVRRNVRDAVAHRPPEQAALVPALVDGDDSGLSDELADDFRTTGLTHLLAVSGTNLTLVVGFLLIVARWCRVRGRWLYVIGAAGIVGFVLLARTEPSVVRAAAMGAVGLLAMGHNGLQRGLRGLGAAVVGLVLVDPGLATTAGFALSVAATAGILLLAPPWRDALSRWMPRWLAEAIAVPAAAQLACTPLVAALSAEVSLVAVLANLLAEPAVGPATVLGLLGGLLGLVWDPLGQVAGTGAAWSVAWIIAVAERCAGLPLPGLGWGTGPLALLLLTALSVGVGLGAPRLLRHRSAGLACVVAMVLVVAIRPPALGRPTGDWVLAMCDVGQGDALAVATGPGSAVVVDAGPDPDLVDSCLDDLGVTSIPLLVITHFHQDHVGGIDGVLSGRTVGLLWTSRQQDPPDGVAVASHAATETGLVPVPAAYGDTRRIGQVTLQVLWPLPDAPTRGPGDGSTANDASVVLLVESRGVRFLLTGDIEPESQAELADRLGDLDVDVLKVPHHGSRYQNLDWLLGLSPEIALTSAGEDNDYGHPAASTLEPLEQAGVEVYRTDEDGTVEVVATPEGPQVR